MRLQILRLKLLFFKCLIRCCAFVIWHSLNGNKKTIRDKIVNSRKKTTHAAKYSSIEYRNPDTLTNQKILAYAHKACNSIYC